jgi:sugar/nucleoside kinase (ribokinase family)
MTRAVVVGDVMVDVVARFSGRLAAGSDAPALIEFHDGGQGANTACWLAAAGTETALVGRIGDDDQGRGAVAELRARGVDARLAADPERPTGTCIVLVAPDGERSMLPDPGANQALAPDDLPEDLLVSGGHLHLAGYVLLRAGSREAGRSAIARAGACGMSVSVDPSSSALLSPGFLDLIGGAGLLMPNAAEAAALSRDPDPERAARRLAERFPEVVVTLGADGALWTDGRELVRAPAPEAAAVSDSTGAGDAFAAGFLSARLEGAEPAEALAAGGRLAAEAVAAPGARPRARG